MALSDYFCLLIDISVSLKTIIASNRINNNNNNNNYNNNNDNNINNMSVKHYMHSRFLD